MNEVLQRRLIGAVVLLALAFLLASLLPDPATSPAASRRGMQAASESQQVVTYDLQTGAPVGLKLAPSLNKPAPTAVPSTSAPRQPQVPGASFPSQAPRPDDKNSFSMTPTTKAPPAVKVQSPEPITRNPPPAPEVKSPAAPSAGSWTVQVGSFGNPDNAQSARKRLQQAGLDASVQEVRAGHALWYRVRVGPFADEARAKTALDKVLRQEFRGAKLISDAKP